MKRCLLLKFKRCFLSGHSPAQARHLTLFVFQIPCATRSQRSKSRVWRFPQVLAARITGADEESSIRAEHLPRRVAALCHLKELCGMRGLRPLHHVHHWLNWERQRLLAVLVVLLFLAALILTSGALATRLRFHERCLPATAP